MRTCENKSCQGYKTREASIEFLDIISGHWFALCKECQPVFERLALLSERMTGILADKRFKRVLR